MAIDIKFVLLGILVNFVNCESDSQPTDATSRIHVVQYQPKTVTQVPYTSITDRHSDNVVSAAQSFDKFVLGTKSDHDNDQLSTVPKNYAFSYAIKDRNTGDDFSHVQAHNGEATKGEYRTKLPDGRLQIVTYTADGDGYRADVRYDKGETSSSSENAASNLVHHQHTFTSGPAKLPSYKTVVRLRPVTAAAANKRQMADKTDSALVYLNEIRSFGVPPTLTLTTARPASSYETVEQVDEEPYPYKQKLLDDVNFLLQYVTPTIESKTENVFDITPDNEALVKNSYEQTQTTPADSSAEKHHIRTKLLQLQKAKFGDPATVKAELEKLNFDSFSFNEINFSTPSPPRHSKARPSTQPFAYSATPTPSPSTSQYEGSRERAQFPPVTEPSDSREAKNYINSGERSPFGAPGEQPPPPPPPPPQPTYPTAPQLVNRFNYHQPRFGPSASSQEQFVPIVRPAQPKQRIKVSVYHVPNFESPENLPLNVIHGVKFAPPLPDASKYTSQEFLPILPTPRPSPLYILTSPPPPSAVHTSQAYRPTPALAYDDYHPPSSSSAFKYATSREQPSTVSQLDSKELPPVSPTPDYSSREHAPVAGGPEHDPKHYPPVTVATPKFTSQEQHSIAPLFKPVLVPTVETPVDDIPRHEFGKIEIPQYLHIHRYEETSDGGTKPQELIFYTPLQIPIANSVAYLERGSRRNTTASSPYNRNITPAYVTMTEHPSSPGDAAPYYRNGVRAPHYFKHVDSNNLTNNASPQYKTYEDYDTPQVKSDNDVDPTLPPANSLADSHSHEQRNPNGRPMTDYDARIYSGYFDFIPPNDAKVASYDDERSREQSGSPAAPTTAPTVESNPLPKFYYDYSTATPAHRYVSAEINSQETTGGGGGDASLQDTSDRVRNSTLKSSAYLRPLRKERVYIHHNALPTAPTVSETRFTEQTAKSSTSKSADVTIVKSISSTIPSELLKEFDRQLISSIQRRRDDDRDDADEANEQRETNEKVTRPPSPRPIAPNTRLKEMIGQKTRSTLPAAKTSSPSTVVAN